jgi:threonine synthase
VEYVSTRKGSPVVDFRGALLGGLAPDGGLYQPTEVPTLPGGWQDWNYVQAVTWSVESFGAEDAGSLVADAASQFRHPDVAPVVAVGDRLVFELFHGPTLSFKDHALQVLGRLLDREVETKSTIVGATSGDTGSAAIEACRGREHLDIVILFPDGMVTDFQRRQMTTVLDENVKAVAVRGTFDDCQAMVKDAFARHEGLLAINSINWTRIAAQTGYYIYLGGQLGAEFDVVVPTGNFGNAYSCWQAKQMGVPIRTITLANNVNRRLSELVTTGVMREVPVQATVAPAMDIAVPSNLERFPGKPSEHFLAGWVDDDTIRATISAVYDQTGYLLDPHTATAWHVGESTRTELPQVVVATAHPAKFAETVTEAIGPPPDLPAGFEAIMDRDERTIVIDAKTSELDRYIR